LLTRLPDRFVLELGMARKQTPEDFWRDRLTHHSHALEFERRFFQLIPSSPRCKLCKTPFGPPGGTFLRLLGRPQSRANPTVCDTCERYLKDYVGGVEIEISMLFADVRGSTSLAEKMNASEFSAIMSRFYSVASDVLVDANAMVNYPAGDQASGIFVPALAGQNHASAAIEAGLRLLQALAASRSDGVGLPVGIGVHMGLAYCGSVETAPGVYDGVALGDSVNTTARLSSAAASGELLISDAAATAARFDTTGLERRELQLKGKSELVSVWVKRAATPATTVA
jgi:adenylate cyclase